MVPVAGLEPARPCGQGILSPLCLPFHHTGQRDGNVQTVTSAPIATTTPQHGLDRRIVNANLNPGDSEESQRQAAKKRSRKGPPMGSPSIPPSP